MTNRYNPSSTAINTGQNPQARACRKQRVKMLTHAGRSGAALSRFRRLRVVAPAALVCALSTLQAAPPADGKTKSQQQATAQRAIRIRVVGPDDKPMPAAQVHSAVWTKEPFEHNHDYVCDGQGGAIVELPRIVDILRIWASAKGYVPLFVHWEKDWQAEGNPIPRQFTVKLTKGTVIGGFVKNEDGQPIQGVKVEVSVHSANRGQPQNEPIVSSWLAYGTDARVTDAQGRWTLDNVPAGGEWNLTLTVSHPDYISDFSPGVLQQLEKISTASLRQQTATLVMARGVRLTGAVTDPQGESVAGAVMVWGDQPYFQQASGEVRTDAKGVYRFPPLPPATITVTVMAEGWAPESRKIAISAANPAADFKLRPGKSLRLRFVDESGKAVPKVYVGIQSWHGSSRSLYNNQHPNVLDSKIPVNADKSGVYLWTWAPGEEVQYYFQKDGYNWASGSFVADGQEHEVRMSRGNEK